jgi:glycosyltransferase involved in cell wall biosynthesis
VPADRQLVLYAGVFNPPQGLDLVLDVAGQRLTRGEDRLHFALIGDGALRDHLLQRVRDEGLSNVTVAGPVERGLVAGLYDQAWATLVILRPRKDEHTVPSKIYEAMAAGRPVILSADGEVAAIVRTAGCGPVSAAGDGPALQASLDGLAADSQRAVALGQAGRRYVEAYNDRAVLARRYLDVLQDAVAARR